ncbi:hypothetical protein [Persephonella sp.]
MSEKDFQTTENMIKYGGSFVKNLGMLARCADPINLNKLKKAFSNYFEQYEKVGVSSPNEQN